MNAAESKVERLNRERDQQFWAVQTGTEDVEREWPSWKNA
jgi:hypothetical protein